MDKEFCTCSQVRPLDPCCGEYRHTAVHGYGVYLEPYSSPTS